MVDLAAARISGRALRTLASSLRRTPLKHVATGVLRKELNIEALRQLDDELRSDVPADYRPIRARDRHARPSKKLGSLPIRDWPRTGRALTEAYRSEAAAVGQVVERAIRGARDLAKLEPPRGPVQLFDEERAFADASASADRIRRGEPLGALDGVPIAIKEEVDVRGLPTRMGTSYLPDTPAKDDCVAVQRLRAAGAIVIGQTPMTEYGMSPLGGNAKRRMPRNAHDPKRLPGGSSTGSGVAVSQGVVPVALGLDGGGSVRIPASFNGVFGLKPTFGRVPTTGHGLRGGSSMVHIGPLGASAHDLATFLEATSGSDAGDSASSGQPDHEPGLLVRALERGVDGLKIGVDEAEWSACDASVAGPARHALSALEREGAELVPVTLRLAPHAAAIGYLTIAIESLTSLRIARLLHMDELGYDLQILLTQVGLFESDDYLDAQRFRATLRNDVASLLRDVDVLALPTAGVSPPAVSDKDAKWGFVDPPALEGVSRYAYVGNLTGIPSGTAPVGADALGLPVGLQILGDAWDDAAVLQVLAHLERMEAAAPARPSPSVDLLSSDRT